MAAARGSDWSDARLAAINDKLLHPCVRTDGQMVSHEHKEANNLETEGGGRCQQGLTCFAAVVRQSGRGVSAASLLHFLHALCKPARAHVKQHNKRGPA